MKDFIISNGLMMLQVLFSILVVFITIFKRKAVVKDTPFRKLLEVLPTLISSAESKFSEGSKKKAFVLASAISFLSDLLDEDPLKVAEIYEDKISTQIEKILMTPEKKKEI